MAGDWIKMRVNLVTHPKVIALSERLSHEGGYQDWSGLAGFIPAIGGTHEDFEEGVMQALRVTRYVAVTALLRFWGYAHEHAKDEFIANLRVADIDEITQVPGFGAALESIGWAVYDEKRKGTLLPNFNEHNAVAKDRGAAERQKRYRERIKERDVIGDVTRDVTRNDREEKRREDKETTSLPRKRGSRLPDDWELPDDWKTWALTEQPSWNDEHVRKVALAFRNYWTAKSGKDAAKLNWFATWQNWVMKEPAAKSAKPVEWWASDSATEAKGRELGISPRAGEGWPQFRDRIRAKLSERAHA